MLKNTINDVEAKTTRIEIFGLGYVGFPLAVRLSTENWKVTGIDIDKNRLERLKQNELSDSELELQHNFIENKKKWNTIIFRKPDCV